MAHALEQFEDKTAFVSARELPWHRLGTITDEAMDAETVLRLAHMANWNVRKEPLFADVNGLELHVPDKFAVVRDNPFRHGEVDVLGVVGRHYEPTQNEDHVEFLNSLVDASGAHFETAGSMNGGKRTFVTMKLPQTIFIAGVDPVDTYISADNSHDGSTSFRVMTTPVRVVCSNTLAYAATRAHRVAKVRHTAGQGGAIARVREALDISFAYTEEFQAEAERMIQETLTNAEFEKIVSQLYPVADTASDLVKGRVEQHRNNVFTLFEASGTLTDVRGTRWAGYNAVTEYLDYFVNVPGKHDRASLLDARAEKALSGESDKLKEKAFELLAV